MNKKILLIDNLFDIPSMTNQQKTDYIMAHRKDEPLEVWLTAMHISRSTFYYHRALSLAPDKDAELKRMIIVIYELHRGNYGYRRITKELRNKGVNVNKKKVSRIMRELNLQGKVSPKRYNSYRGDTATLIPDLICRQFTAERKNQKWVTDITKLTICGRTMYLAVILDLYTGRVVSYKLRRTDCVSLVKNVVDVALATSTDIQPGLILHSDRGWQYQTMEYQQYLISRGVRQSMSEYGNCYNNARMESFFATMKRELLVGNQFADVNTFVAALADYIRYYNEVRIGRIN